MFDIPDSSVEILSAAGGEISSLVKLHFELRLSLNDFKDAGIFRTILYVYFY